MVRAERGLPNQWKEQCLPPLDLDTGPIVVGNMGSKTRFDYIVIGDAVNLGYRIETFNKQTGTHILILEFT